MSLLWHQCHPSPNSFLIVSVCELSRKLHLSILELENLLNNLSLPNTTGEKSRTKEVATPVAESLC